VRRCHGSFAQHLVSVLSSRFWLLGSGFWVPRLSGFEFGFGLGLEVRVVARLS